MGKTKECDCYIGKRFGTLVLVKSVRVKVPPSKEKRKTRAGWLCKCDCGKYVERITDRLKATSTCGEFNSYHLKWGYNDTNGGKYVTIYERWKNMIERCYNPKHFAYKYYGGRGIKVCDEWKNDYASFRKWYLEQGFNIENDNRTTDRIDVNGNYEPSNCRLATPQEQANNKRTTRYVEHDGKKFTARDIANMYPDIPYNTIRARIQQGFGWEDIIRNKRNPKKTLIFGEYLTNREISDKYRLKYETVRSWTRKKTTSEIEEKIRKYGEVY